MKIRTATPQDIPSIQDIARITWPITYGQIHVPGQTSFMLDLFYRTETLAAQMEDEHQFLVLQDEQDFTVGFAGFEFNHEGPNGKLLKLYLLPNFQGKGYGKLLMTAVIEACKSADQKKLIVFVNRHNAALEFYKKHGFVIVESVDNEIGNGYFMNDYVMELSLE